MIRAKIIAAALFAAIAAFAALPTQAQYFGLTGSSWNPTLGACGAGATLSAGAWDHAGTINVGTGLVTTCTLNFGGAPLVGVSTCIIDAHGLATSPVMTGKTVTSSGFTVTFLLSIPGAQVDYLCIIN